MAGLATATGVQNILGCRRSRPPSQLPIAVMIPVGSLAAPWLVRLVGSRPATVGVMVALLAGLLWLALGDTTSGFDLALLCSLLMIGTRLGLGFVGATTTAVTGATAGEAGLLSELINVIRQLGGALALAALIAVTAAGSATGPGSGVSDGIDYPSAFLGAAALALLALALSLAPRPTASQPSPKEANRDRSHGRHRASLVSTPRRPSPRSAQQQDSQDRNLRGHYATAL